MEDKESRIPTGKQRAKNLLYDGILLAGVALLLWGGGSAIRKHFRDEEDKKLYKSLNEEFVEKNTEEKDGTRIVWGGGNGDAAATGTIWYKKATVNFEGLNAINEDVIGWLFFENESISYPILYSGDNEYYLHRTLDRADSESGSLFLDEKNNPLLDDKVSIIYGHNMKNSSMFGKLRQYKEKDDYYKDHQYFQVLTEGGKVYRYQVFSYFDIDQHEVDMVDVGFYDPLDSSTFVTEMKPKDNSKAIGNIMKLLNNPKKKLSRKKRNGYRKQVVELASETEAVVVNKENTYENYLATIRSRSLRETGIAPGTGDKVVGLFTCSSHHGNRLIVYGVRVAEHDLKKVAEDRDIETLDR